MSRGERLLLYRDTIRARFPILTPTARILPDVPSGPNVRFVDLDLAGQGIYETAATFWVDWSRAAHEHGHEVEKRIVREIARTQQMPEERATNFVRERFYTWRRIPGTWQQAEREANAMGEQGRQSFHPVEVLAHSFAWALGADERERSIAEVYPVAREAQFAWWQEMQRAAGCTLPALTYRPSPNFRPGRALPIRYIVLHTTQGTNSLGWLTGSASQLSAHYLMREEDEYQLVSEESTAWHAGDVSAWGATGGRPRTPLYIGVFLGFDSLGRERWSVNPNDESIGIEMEGYAAGDVSPTIIARTAARIRDIRQRRGPLPIVDHGDLSPRNRSDPGAHNRAAVEALLGEELDMAITEDRLREIIREELGAVTLKLDSFGGRTLNHKLRRTARAIATMLRAPGAPVVTQDPGGVGGVDQVGYQTDDTPLG